MADVLQSGPCSRTDCSESGIPSALRLNFACPFTFPCQTRLKFPEIQSVPSAARLAAEAFFSQRPAEQPDGAPVVTVVKGRVEPPTFAEPAEAAPQEAARPPRVFRLPSPASTEANLQTALESTAAGAQELAKSETGTNLPTAAGRKLRRSRRQLHGEVTITRPDNESLVTTQGPDVLAERGASAAPARLEPMGAQDLRLTVQESSEGGDTWPRYPAMLRRLRALQAEAEEARQRERRAALVWIRQAIADYDLSSSELGLR